VDWDLGNYEYVAQQLLPAANAVVAHLAPVPNEAIGDVGCGTGNAALIAASMGAVVTGIDPSPRLLEVARRDSRSKGLEVDFRSGSAGALPVPDASLDAIVSVFGVIFAPDASAAASEMDRALKSSGRIVLSAWTPGGAIGEQANIRREAVAAVLDESHGSPPFAWHDPSAARDILRPYGFSVEVEEAQLAFKAISPDEYIDGEFENHPLWVEARSILEPAGTWQETRAAAGSVLSAANEDSNGFCVTSRYVIVTARRGL
jgi:SAM-dependent methyltransferase